ncbi:MAG: HAMP domain-containing sensor histidine kinase [Thermodesulfobacteriota bacterium]|nr:HAMP domain-containing sensor histidine kinase [Thermodesulfobacteriota bacterium]
MEIENTNRWYLHPVFVFACSIVSLATALVITIYWYMEITSALEIIIKKFNIDPGQIFPSRTGMLLIVLTLLITVVLTGIFLAFIYYQRTVSLFRLQHNFVYNFTHELKTPVTSLKIYLETFLRHDLDSTSVKKYSQYMLSDVTRLIDNINAILNLAKIESASYGAEIACEDLVVRTEEICHKNGTLFRNCTIDITNQTGREIVCPVNMLLYEMLVMNILSNAVKYNVSENPRVSICFYEIKKKVMIDFSDNGIGIEKKEIKKIFRKFYTTTNREPSQVKGSGLGLYLVYSIAKIHGWRVVAKSAGRDEGAVFTISLPGEGFVNVKGRTLWKMLKKSASWS